MFSIFKILHNFYEAKHVYESCMILFKLASENGYYFISLITTFVESSNESIFEEGYIFI